MEDDAKAAVEKLNGQKIKNALVTLDFAKHRNRKDPKEKPVEVVKKDAGDRKKLDKYVRLLERSVIVSNLPQVDKKIVYKKMRKFGQVEQIEFPQPIPDVKLVNERSAESDFKGERCALVTYATKKEAEKACKLHEHIFKGEKLKVRIHPHPIHAKINYRLVVRNVPFELEKSALFATLNKFVCVVELTLMKGYGFVTLCCKEDCDLLMNEVNGKVLDSLKRPLIIDYSLSKDEFKKVSDDQVKAVAADDMEVEERDSAIDEGDVMADSDVDEIEEENLEQETIAEEVDAFLEKATKEDSEDDDEVDVQFDQEIQSAEIVDAEDEAEN
jgi:RNA recognition motif-containing protein